MCTPKAANLKLAHVANKEGFPLQMGGQKWLQSGLVEIYLFMQLTRCSGAAAHWSDPNVFDKIRFFPPICH